ncbi:hypothetical protein EVA_07747 [gut metagenome]|uniref:Uncharacterized protein n=1 Tax=gut metagenome TaxID=749906 RepID=J9CVA1_9ZZZZ
MSPCFTTSLILPLAADTTSCPQMLRTFSINNSSATRLCRTVTLSNVRFVNPVS